MVQARRRCSGVHQVAFERLKVPDDWPQQTFDLIVLSEVLYYLSPEDVARTARQSRESLRPQGSVLLVHYILPTDYPCTGETATQIFIAEARLTATLQRRESAYRLDLLRA